VTCIHKYLFIHLFIYFIKLTVCFSRAEARVVVACMISGQYRMGHNKSHQVSILFVLLKHLDNEHK